MSTQLDLDFPEVVPEENTGEVPSPPELFPEITTLHPCSSNQCSRGHTWPPRIAIVECSGCHAPILAVLKQNCPVCNEPVVSMRVRSDHIPRGAPVVPLCRPGVSSPGEVTEILMERTYWRTPEPPEDAKL